MLSLQKGIRLTKQMTTEMEQTGTAEGTPLEEKKAGASLSCTWLGSAVTFIGLGGLLGYLLQIPILRSYLPYTAPEIPFPMTFGFFFLGLALVLAFSNQPSIREKPIFRLFHLLSLVIPISIGLYFVLQYLLVAGLDIPLILTRDYPEIPVSPLAALKLLILSVGLIVFEQWRQKGKLPGFGLGIAALMVLNMSLFSVIGYQANLPLLYGFDLALPGVIALILGSITILKCTIPLGGVLSPLASRYKAVKLPAVFTLVIGFAILMANVFLILEIYKWIPPELIDIPSTNLLFIGLEYGSVFLALVLQSLSFAALYSFDQSLIAASQEKYARIELEETNTALRESEQKLKESFKALSDIKRAVDESTIVAITDSQGRITYANSAFCQVSQYSEQELMGQTHRIVNSGYHSQEFFKNLWDTISSGSVWRGVLRNKAKDGTFYWASTTIVPFLDEYGRPEQYIAIRHDITSQKLAEEKIYNLNVELEDKVQERTAQLQAINKELESFAYSVSHDLRTPLRSIEGFSQRVLKRKADQLDEEGKEYLGYVCESSHEMAQLIDDLLDLSRLSRAELRREQVNLSELAEEAIRELREQESERYVEVYIQPELYVSGDSHLLRVVFKNLLGNAWKFTGLTPHAVIEFGQMEQNDKKVYFVRDNGAGFELAYASKLFGAFQRLHDTDEFPGTGIGLATVQRIIHRHEGSVWAESAINMGATFYFTL